jgi:Sec-independent protein translocase protein TatA
LVFPKLGRGIGEAIHELKKAFTADEEETKKKK